MNVAVAVTDELPWVTFSIEKTALHSVSWRGMSRKRSCSITNVSYSFIKKTTLIILGFCSSNSLMMRKKIHVTDITCGYDVSAR